MNFNNIPQVTKILLLVNIAIFLIASLTGYNDYLITNFGVYYPIMPEFKLYQVITSMFIHANFMHLLFNMFGLFMFGGQIENYFGEKRYILLYFLSGLGAFLLQSLWVYLQFQESSHLIMNGEIAQVSNTVLQELSVPMIGASGAIFGVLAAFAVVYPNVPLMFIFIPVPIKAKYFIAGYFVIEVIQGVMTTGNVAHFAHVGGAIVGYFLSKSWMKNRYRMQ